MRAKLLIRANRNKISTRQKFYIASCRSERELKVEGVGKLPNTNGLFLTPNNTKVSEKNRSWSV